MPVAPPHVTDVELFVVKVSPVEETFQPPVPEDMQVTVELLRVIDLVAVPAELKAPIVIVCPFEVNEPRVTNKVAAAMLIVSDKE